MSGKVDDDVVDEATTEAVKAVRVVKRGMEVIADTKELQGNILNQEVKARRRLEPGKNKPSEGETQQRIPGWETEIKAGNGKYSDPNEEERKNETR